MLQGIPGAILRVAQRAAACALAASVVPGASAFGKTKITRLEISGSSDMWPAGIANGAAAGTYTDSLHSPHGFVRADDGKITTFDVGSSGTEVTGINEDGAITGYYIGSGPNAGAGVAGNSASSRLHRGVIVVTHGYVRAADGTVVTFDVPQSVSTGAQAINAGGAVTGDYFDSSLVQHGYVRSAGGTFTDFDPPGSTATSPHAINGNGAITGWYVDSKAVQHGFVRIAGGTITIFDPAGSTSTAPSGINMRGDIVGSYESAGVWHGFVRASDGTVTTIDPPGSVGTAVCCVDDQGRLAGDYFDDNDVDHGFTRSKSGKITSFDVSGAAGTMAVGMDRKRSDEGALVGTYSEGLDTYGFLRSP